jgi:hypothetical protein
MKRVTPGDPALTLTGYGAPRVYVERIRQRRHLQSVYASPMLRGNIRHMTEEGNDALTISRNGSLSGRLLVA